MKKLTFVWVTPGGPKVMGTISSAVVICLKSAFITMLQSHSAEGLQPIAQETNLPVKPISHQIVLKSVWLSEIQEPLEAEME